MTNWKLDWKPLNEQDIRLIREVTGIVEQTNIGCRSCGEYRNGNLISGLAPTCPGANKNVGDVIYMNAKPTGGTVPYTVSFKKGTVLLKQFTGVTEGQQVTYDYTILPTDAGATHTFSDNTIDSCSVGAKFCNEQCLVTVNAIVSKITVTSPNGGEDWQIGNTHNITWISTGILPTELIKIHLFKAGIWKLTIDETQNIGSYTWVVPAILVADNDYSIKVEKSTDQNIGDFSNTNFSISTPIVICNVPVCNLVVT